MAAFQSCDVDSDVDDDVIARQQLVPDASNSNDNSDSWPSGSRDAGLGSRETACRRCCLAR